MKRRKGKNAQMCYKKMKKKKYKQKLTNYLSPTSTLKINKVTIKLKFYNKCAYTHP